MDEILREIKSRLASRNYEIGPHAKAALMRDDLKDDELIEATLAGIILEDYPEDVRGHSCLIYGKTSEGKHVHAVVTTETSPMFFITAYSPKPPKWITPLHRG